MLLVVLFFWYQTGYIRIFDSNIHKSDSICNRYLSLFLVPIVKNSFSEVCRWKKHNDIMIASDIVL